MSDDVKITRAPELYARMQVPHPTKAEAEAALAAFDADVRAARERHRIAAVVVGSLVRWVEDGRAVTGVSCGSSGDPTQAAFLATAVEREFADPVVDNLLAKAVGS